MIEQAFVSGQLGRVLYDQGGVLYGFGPMSEPAPAQVSELGDVLKTGAEYEIVSNANIEILKALLCDRVAKHNALFLFISLIDTQLSLSTRIAVAQVVEPVLADGQSRSFVCRRLLSLPMPVQTRSLRHQATEAVSGFPAIRGTPQ